MKSTPLHALGEALRDALLAVPMPVVRGLFLALFAGLLIWVWTLPRAVTTDPDAAGHGGANLKIGATIALVLQLLIYAFL
ncbi:MAG: hypothetical protein KF861_15695 [Planctomycetaceae bacterium]|nr:hypothetical protein [Planctomycetaceae bacterium]